LLIFNWKDDVNITSISASYYSSCYTTSDGSLYALGVNIAEEKGTKNNFFIDKPQKISVPGKVKKAVVSLNSLAYVEESGDVYILGIYGRGRDGNYLETNRPMKVEGLTNIRDIKAGEMHFLALCYDGTVWAWGENEYYQVSSEINNETWTPQKVKISERVMGIECGFYNSCVYTENQVYIWGEDAFGLTEKMIIKDKYILNVNSVQDVSIGRNHFVVIVEDDVLGYGSNAFGQMGGTEDFLYGASLDFENVDEISCGITSTVFLMDDNVFYLGDINPFDDEKEKRELSYCNLKLEEILLVECKSFHLISANKKNIEWHGYSPDDVSYNKREINNGELNVALIDTGVDVNNEMIRKLLGKSKRTTSDSGIYSQISAWNLCDGTETVFEDVSTDAHGTSMLGLILDVKWPANSNDIVSYQDDFNVIVLKAINGTGGKFIDILTAISIAESKNCQIINCSFSINKQCYENIIEKRVKSSNSFFVFSLKNDIEQDIAIIESSNVLYVFDGTTNGDIEGNVLGTKLGEVKLLGCNNEVILKQSNSCATAYVTNKIANMFLCGDMRLSADNIIEKYMHMNYQKGN